MALRSSAASWIIIAATVFSLTGTEARGSDTDEVKKLKERIEFLEAKLKLAEKEIELLKKENELKVAKPGEKEGVKKSLSAQLSANQVLTGTTRLPDGSGANVTLTINERNGGKVKATWLAKDMKTGMAYPEVAFEGDVEGARLTMQSVGGAAKFRVSLMLEGEYLKGSIIHQDNGTKVTAGFKFQK